MSALFHRLTDLFERGHRLAVEGLLSDERYAAAGRTADAAVLIAVTERRDPGVILTRRPNTMRDHPGQVAFPGGKLEPGENAVEAALREAHEELAIDPAHVRVIGTTDRYQTGTGFDVTPVLGLVPPDLPIVPNPGEVEAWFEVPLRVLLEREHWQEHEVFWQGANRRYLQLDWQGFRIWGVTAAIIANLARRLEIRELLDG